MPFTTSTPSDPSSYPLDKIRQIMEDIRNSKQDDKYVKFEDGQKAIFEFLPEKLDIVFKKWDGKQFHESDKQEDKDFRKYYRFVVFDIQLDKERIWDCSNFKAAEKILEYLQQQKTTLKVKRLGTEKNTVYDVEEV